MVDKDSNIIKPVDSLHNIAGVTPTRRREERKRRQDSYRKKEQKPQQELNEPVDEQNLNDKSTENENGRNSDTTGIDYRA
jgi:hypothetical protein